MLYNEVMKKQIQQKDYTVDRGIYQLILPLNYEVIIPADDSVRLLSQISEGLDYKELYKAYSSRGRNPVVEPRIMFKILVYGYMNGLYSSRKIEKACLRDINFMWLLEGEKAPDHTTINSFRKDRLGGCMEELFYQFVKALHEIGEINYENIFIDGTKIEANANKYTFVWRKAVEKNEAKMHVKVKGIAEELKKLYFKEFEVREEKIDEDMYAMIKFLEDKKISEKIEFVHGIGKRKSNVQKLLEALYSYRERQEDYNMKNETFNGRNSYSKTDTDATFMHLKDDHMKNGQLKAAYNVQIGVESEYITGLGVYQHRSDVGTMIPLLERIKLYTGIYYKNIIADAGYESEENYTYLDKTGQNYYIKPQLYERMQKRNFKKDISKRENMSYDENKDEYICHNNKRLKPIKITNKKSSTGYVSEVTTYECESCEDCTHKSKCTKAKGNRQIQVSKNFIEKRQKSYENITSEEGVVLRVNRSIQVEGAFGVLKEDRGFSRFLTRGMINVTTEMLLLCFSYNVEKLHAKIQNGRCGNSLHKVKTAQ